MGKHPVPSPTKNRVVFLDPAPAPSQSQEQTLRLTYLLSFDPPALAKRSPSLPGALFWTWDLKGAELSPPAQESCCRWRKLSRLGKFGEGKGGLSGEEDCLASLLEARGTLLLQREVLARPQPLELPGGLRGCPLVPAPSRRRRRFRLGRER